MIQKEFYMTREDGVNLYRIYSDQNIYIEQEQTKAKYTEAIDVEDNEFTYIETDIQIEAEPEPTQLPHPRPDNR